MKRCGWKVEYKQAALGPRGSVYPYIHLTSTLTWLGVWIQSFKTKKSVVLKDKHCTARGVHWRALRTSRVVVANGTRKEGNV